MMLSSWRASGRDSQPILNSPDRFIHSSANMSDFPGLPPFPEGVATVPLLVIDFALIQRKDKAETDKLWKAATEFGFW